MIVVIPDIVVTSLLCAILSILSPPIVNNPHRPYHVADGFCRSTLKRRPVWIKPQRQTLLEMNQPNRRIQPPDGRALRFRS
jgi:hypothetical protein